MPLYIYCHLQIWYCYIFSSHICVCIIVFVFMFVFAFAFYFVFEFNFVDCIWKFGRRRENWPSDQGAAYFPINAHSSTLLEVVLYYDTPPHVPPHIQIQMLYTENLYLYFKYLFAYFCTPRQADSSTACAHILHGKLIHRWSALCIFCFCYHCIFCKDAHSVTGRIILFIQNENLLGIYHWMSEIDDQQWWIQATVWTIPV